MVPLMSEVFNYLRYADDLEKPKPDEQKVFQEIADSMHRLGDLMVDRYRHAFRTVHAKSHGVLKASFQVDPNLPEPLAQGLFAAAGTYPAILRFSTNPGDVLADSVSTPRGLAIKVLNVPGEAFDADSPPGTQDFVFANGKTFAAPDAAAFLKAQKLIESHANDPEPVKKVVSAGARGVNAVLGLVGHESKLLAQLGYPPTHPLGETYGSLVPLRYGDYVAKLIVRPLSRNLKLLEKEMLNVKFHYSALRDAIAEFFKTQTAEWEVCAQLGTDAEKMPIEDGSVEWPEDLSPYRRVARITATPQDTYSPARRVYVDDRLSFNPWHCLAAHRPLGNIMRARKVSYPVSVKLRSMLNAVTIDHPTSIESLPD